MPGLSPKPKWGFPTVGVPYWGPYYKGILGVNYVRKPPNPGGHPKETKPPQRPGASAFGLYGAQSSGSLGFRV